MNRIAAMNGRRLPDTGQRALLYAPDNRHQARLSAKLAGLAELQWLDSRDITPTLLATPHASWRLVLLDYSDGNAHYSSDVARQLHLLLPDVPLVAVGSASQEQTSSVLAALRAGVREFIDIDSPAEDIQAALLRVLAQPQPGRAALPPAPAAARGRLVLLLGCRAGIGTTTLATELGVALQLAAPAGDTARRRLLLDLGQPAGDAALYLNAATDFDYAAAQRNLSRLDATLARTAIAQHPSGLAVLGHGSGELPEDAADPGPLVDRLRGVFDLVLCDLGGTAPPYLPDVLLRQADELWLACDQTIGALVSLDQLLRSLDARGQRDLRLHLVVNRYDPEHGLDTAALCERFGVPVLATLPDRARPLRACASEGLLLAQRTPNDPYVKALAPLLRRLEPECHPVTAATPWQRLSRRLSNRPWKTK